MRQLDIRNPFNAPVYHEETVGSTMEVSRFLEKNGAPHGTVITADFQEAGRGRIKERRWETERGTSLAFTVLLRFTDGIPVALSLRAGLAVALAIEDFAPRLSGKALIKWPNDILLPVPGKDGEFAALKTAGILTEADGSPDGVPYGGNVFIGIGINFSQKQMPNFLRDKATSLCIAAGGAPKGADRFKLLEKILLRLRDEIEVSEGEGWRERLEARLYKKGEQVCFAVGAADSGNTVTGTLAGIGPEGELLVSPSGRTDTLAFTAGELLFFI